MVAVNHSLTSHCVSLGLRLAGRGGAVVQCASCCTVYTQTQEPNQTKCIDKLRETRTQTDAVTHTHHVTHHDRPIYCESRYPSSSVREARSARVTTTCCRSRRIATDDTMRVELGMILMKFAFEISVQLWSPL